MEDDKHDPAAEGDAPVILSKGQLKKQKEKAKKEAADKEAKEKGEDPAEVKKEAPKGKGGKKLTGAALAAS